MPRTHGPLFDKLMPRRGLQRVSEDILRQRLFKHTALSTTHSYNGVPCLEYQRSLRAGYGRLFDGRALRGTHVIAYEINVGPVPDGHHVLHHCDNPPCCEPSHLWTGAPADNMADRDRKGRNGGHKNKGHKNGPSKMRGEKHPRSVATEAMVRVIRKLPTKERHLLPREFLKPGGGLNRAAIARHYGISGSLVHGILSGRNWAWLK